MMLAVWQMCWYFLAMTTQTKKQSIEKTIENQKLISPKQTDFMVFLLPPCFFSMIECSRSSTCLVIRSLALLKEPCETKLFSGGTPLAAMFLGLLNKPQLLGLACQ